MKVIRRSAVFSAAGQSPNKVAKLSRMWSAVVVAVAMVSSLRRTFPLPFWGYRFSSIRLPVRTLTFRGLGRVLGAETAQNLVA